MDFLTEFLDLWKQPQARHAMLVHMPIVLAILCPIAVILSALRAGKVTFLRSMALILSLVAGTGRSVSALADDMPRYEMIKQRCDLATVGGRDAVAEMIARVAAAYRDERLDTSDGVRVDFEAGWVHLRPSNTEPIVRLIAEASTPADAQALAARVAQTAGFVR